MKPIKSLICISVAIAISACGDNQSAQTYIKNAETLLVDEQPSAAIIALKNALKISPDNAKARFLLGRLYLSLGDGDNAEKELERAYKLKYELAKVVPLLARAYMLTESDDDILLLASKEQAITANSTQYLAYKTLASLRVGDTDLANEAVSAAALLAETDGYSVLAKAYVEFSQQNIAQARTLVERILAASQNNADALMLKGQIASTEKDYGLAVASFQAYKVLQPNSNKVQIFIADALLKNKQFDEAEAIADSILANIPTQPFMQYIKAMVRFENQDYKAASSLANQSLSSGFTSFSLKLTAGASAFYLKNYEQCHLHLEDLLPYLPSEHAARRMLAVSQLQLGLIEDISETLNGYDSVNKDNAQFLSTLSHELLEIGAYDKAQEMANYAASSSEVTAEQSVREGILKLMMNDPSGIEQLEVALQQNPELISAELALAFTSIQSGDLARANEIADKWLEKYPDKAGGYNLKAAISFKENDITQGRLALENSLRVEPNNPFAFIEMIKLAIRQQDTEQALTLTEKGLAAHPNNIKILRLYFSLHQNETGLAIITTAQQNNDEVVEYGVLLAEALMHLEKFKQASAVLDSYKANLKTPKRYWQLALMINTKLVDSLDNFTILDKWQKSNPYHIEPVLLLVRYWMEKNSPERALSVLKRSLSKHADHLMLHLVKMQVLLTSKQVNEARDFFPVIVQLDLPADLLAGIDGRILLLERKFSAAVAKLAVQYQAKPTSSNANYLAFALDRNNQKTEAITLLEKFSQQENAEPKIHLSLANMYLAEHQGKAIIEYEQLIRKTPDNVIALNNLSWLYMEEGKYAQALQHAEHAYKLSATIPNVVDTYAQALLKSAKVDEALAKAEEAYQISKGEDVDIALNLVETLLANSKVDEAQRVLTSINTVTPAQQARKQLLSK